jgi:hypothetical protein
MSGPFKGLLSIGPRVQDEEWVRWRQTPIIPFSHHCQEAVPLLRSGHCLFCSILDVEALPIHGVCSMLQTDYSDFRKPVQMSQGISISETGHW